MHPRCVDSPITPGKRVRGKYFSEAGNVPSGRQPPWSDYRHSKKKPGGTPEPWHPQDHYRYERLTLPQSTAGRLAECRLGGSATDWGTSGWKAARGGSSRPAGAIADYDE